MQGGCDRDLQRVCSGGAYRLDVNTWSVVMLCEGTMLSLGQVSVPLCVLTHKLSSICPQQEDILL